MYYTSHFHVTLLKMVCKSSNTSVHVILNHVKHMCYHDLDLCLSISSAQYHVPKAMTSNRILFSASAEHHYPNHYYNVNPVTPTLGPWVGQGPRVQGGWMNTFMKKWTKRNTHILILFLHLALVEVSCNIKYVIDTPACRNNQLTWQHFRILNHSITDGYMLTEPR